MPSRSRKDDGSKEAKAPRKRAGKRGGKVDGRGGARPGAGRPRVIQNGQSKPFAVRLPGWVVDGIKAGGPAAVEEVRRLIVRWAERKVKQPSK